MITNVLKNKLANSLIGVNYDAASYVAFGDDNTEVTSSDTTLGNEIIRKVYNDRSVDGNTMKLSGTLSTTDANGDTIKEIGLLNAATSGDLFSRQIVSDIAKSSSFELEITYSVTLL